MGAGTRLRRAPQLHVGHHNPCYPKTIVPNFEADKTMKTILLFVAAVLFASPATAASANIDLSLECTVSGTKIGGEKSPKPFLEKFRIIKKQTVMKNKDGKDETWGISNTEYSSDGKKYEASTIDASAEHAVVSIARVVGAGYNRKLLVFTLILDLNALELDRVVTSVPAGSDERTRSTCKKI